MKAIIYTIYGSPEVLQATEMDQPVPQDNELLIKVQATTVAATDSIFRSGRQFSARMFTGLLKPKNPILGDVLAGEVQAIGKDVTAFKVGDRVFGSTDTGFGSYAEYKCLPDDAPLVMLPATFSAEEAVAVCDGALTALTFLRDAAKVQTGQRVLINGASGSIGTAAVQLAKHFGAEVTGVCSTPNVELVQSLGADAVIDYKKEDFTQTGHTYDVIFDTVGKSSFGQAKRALTPEGIYLSTVVSLTILRQMLWTSNFGSQKAMIAFAGLRASEEKKQDLQFLTTLLEAGTLQPVIDRQYTLAQIPEAHSYVDQGRKRGSVVITV